MSRDKRKYPRVETLFSKAPPAAPDSPQPAAPKPPLPAPRAAQPADDVPTVAARGPEEPGAPREAPPPANALSVPLAVSGETVGAVLASGEAPWTAREIELVDGVAARLARHLENLRRAAP